MFETKLHVITGQSELNEYVHSSVAPINCELWVTGAATIRGFESRARSLVSPSLGGFPTSACEYLSVSLRWSSDLQPSALQGIYFTQ